MEERIKQIVREITREKYINNEAYPVAHSIEIAHRLKMNAGDVEVIAAGIPGLKIHKTINGEFYET